MCEYRYLYAIDLSAIVAGVYFAMDLTLKGGPRGSDAGIR
jgi:hypothetical protein